MECRELRETLSAYVDGQAAPADTGPVESHLEGCAACRALLERMRAAEGLLARVEARVPDGFREALFARLEKEEILPRRRSLFVFSVRWLAVPAAAAAALALFLFTSKEVGVDLKKGAEPPARVGQGSPAGAAPGADSRSAGPVAPEPGPVPAATASNERSVVAMKSAPGPSGSALSVGGPDGSVSAAVGELTGDEREIVAWLEVLENPVVLEEPGDVDELEIFAVPNKDRG